LVRGLSCAGKVPKVGALGECDHKIVTWQLFFQLILNPQLRFMMLAMRTAAMPAGMGNKALVVTIGTVDLHNRTELSPTDFKGIQSGSLNRQNLALIGIKEISLKLIDNRGKQNHLIVPHETVKPSIS
jgi:hypothetical protein